MTYKAYNADEIDCKMWSILKRLAFRYSSGLKDDYIPYMQSGGKGRIVVAYNDIGKIVGWSCHTPGHIFKALGSNTSLFVSTKYRHQGIGRELVNYLYKEFGHSLQAQVIRKNYDFFNKVLPEHQEVCCFTNDWQFENKPMGSVDKKSLLCVIEGSYGY
jgi:GNAT superfamily N-acetyltransferase